jgi:signal transduction histidine kinase
MTVAQAPAGLETSGAGGGLWQLRRHATSRLFRRYFVVSALGTCGILLPAIAVEMVLNYMQGLATIERVQTIHANAAAAQIDSLVDTIELQIREVADLPWGRGGLSEADRRAEFQRLLKRVPAILELYRYDADGRETLYVSRMQEDRVKDATAPPLSESARAAAGEIRFGAVEFRDALEPFVRTIMHEGAFGDGGWVKAVIDLKHVAEFVAKVSIEGGGTAYLVDNTGMVIAHPKAEFMLRRTYVADPGIFAYTTDRSSRRETRAAIHSVSLDGSSAYSGMTTIESPPWTVVIEQPADLVRAPLRRSLLSALGILAGALVLSFFVSLWYARRLSRPILALEAGAAAFGRGNLRQRVDVHTGDEIELLADQFNRMAEQLQEYTESLERKVAEKTHELEMANRHKSEFLANMSHELRTPLNAVIGFSEVLKERMFGDLNDKQLEYVRDIYGSGQHLLSLINDILDLTKVEAGQMTLDLQEVDVPAAVKNCATLIRERAVRNRLKFECVVDPGVSRWPADERKFKQVLINLLSNAVKFTPAGGSVTLHAMVERGWLVVSVRDTGIGIAPEDRAVIFQEFQQVRPASGAKHEGTGLGLSLSRRLVELHHGTLTVESAPGRGSTFTARFPGPGRTAHD